MNNQNVLVSVHTIEFKIEKFMYFEYKKIIEKSKLICDKGNKKSKLKIYEYKTQKVKYKIVVVEKGKWGNTIMKIEIDPRNFFEKSELENSDLKLNEDELIILLKRLTKELSDILSLATIDSIIFTRIDFFADWKEKDNIRKIIIKLLKKTKSVHKRKEKKNYPNGAYYNGQSIRINIYDRKQRILSLIVDEEEEEADYIEEILKSIPDDVIRFEVQVLNRRLNSNKNNKKNPIAKDISNYYNRDVATNYLKKELRGIVFSGQYYNSIQSEKHLKATYCNEKLVSEILEFQKYISEHGMDKTLEKYNKYFFNKYISLLEGADVNPFLIPEKDRISFFNNPMEFLKKEA